MILKLIELENKMVNIQLPSKSEIYIGRLPSNDIVFTDIGVSRRHCVIRYYGSYCSIEDLQSHNGTFLNQERLKNEHPLVSGDVISIVGMRFRFEIRK